MYPTNTTLVRAAIYARNSTNKQDDLIQLTALEEYVKHRLWAPRFYGDQLSDGVERPGLKRLLEDAGLKKIDVVLVWKLDRFGQSLRYVLVNIQTLDRAGVRFMVPQQGLDTDKNNTVGGLLGALAELERSFIVERTQAGYAAYREAYSKGQVGRTRHAQSGKDLPVGRPPRIFRRDQARELRAGGMSWRKIAAKLRVPQSTIRAAVGFVD